MALAATMGARPSSSMRLRMATERLAMRLSGGAATVCTNIVHIMSPASWLLGITCGTSRKVELDRGSEGGEV